MEDLTPRNNRYSHRYLKHKLILFPQDQFTGRRKEIDLLLLSFEQMLSRGASLSSRGPRIFLIQGKEWIGKTRLLEEFSFPLQMEGFPFLIMDMLNGGKPSDSVFGGFPLNLVDRRSKTYLFTSSYNFSGTEVAK